MSSFPQGSVPITFAADRTQIDSFLSELRKGYVVPIRPEVQGGGGTSFAPGVPRTPAWNAGDGSGGASGGTDDRRMQQNAKRVDDAWDRAMLAQQKAAEAAERRARAQEDRERKAEQRERQRSAMPSRVTNSDLIPEETATPVRDSDLVQERRGLKMGRLAQYATVGFLVNEGARVAEAAMTRRSDMALAQTGMDKVRAEMGLVNAITGIPVVGPMAAIATDLLPMNFIRSIIGNHAASMAEYKKANQAAEESIKDVATHQGLLASSNSAFVTGSTYEMEAARLRMRPGFDRQIQATRDAEAIDQQQAKNYEQEMQQKITEPNISQFDKQRLMDELNSHYRDRRKVAPALHDKTQAEIADLERQRGEMAERENRRAAGLGAAAEGRFGVAAERDFDAQLEQGFADAAPQGMKAQFNVAKNNIMRRAARDEEIRLRIRDRENEAWALNAEMDRNPLEALRRRVSGNLEHDLHFAANDEEAFSMSMLAQLNLTKQTRQIKEAKMLERVGLRAQAESLGFIVNGAGSPADREMAAQVNTIKRRTQLSELQAFVENKGDLVPDIAKLGALQLGAMKEQFLSGLKPVETDINRTALQGAGTEDVGKVNQKIDEAIAEIKKLPQSFKDAVTDLNALASD